MDQILKALIGWGKSASNVWHPAESLTVKKKKWSSWKAVWPTCRGCGVGFICWGAEVANTTEGGCPGGNEDYKRQKLETVKKKGIQRGILVKWSTTRASLFWTLWSFYSKTRIIFHWFKHGVERTDICCDFLAIYQLPSTDGGFGALAAIVKQNRWGVWYTQNIDFSK